MNKALLRPFSIAIALLWMCIPSHSFGEKFFTDNDAFFLKYLQQQKFDLDTLAPAVVLYECYSYDYMSSLHTKLKVRRVIKVLKRENSAYADIEIPLPGYKYGYYQVNKVHGTTYNLVDGKITSQAIDEENVALEQSKTQKTQKISLPAVRAGSVIDYSFEIEADRGIINTASWEIQTEIPKLYSKLEIYVPNTCIFTADDPIVPVFIEVNEKKKDNIPVFAYTYAEDLGSELVKQYWVRRNVASFSEEPFLPCEKNYRETMQVYLESAYFRSEQLGVGKWTNSWDKVNKSLTDDFHFSRAVTEGSPAITQKAHQLAGDDTDKLEIAHRIYKFVCDSVKSFDDGSPYTMRELSTILDQKEGSASGVNLLLTALMARAKLYCRPVIVASTDKPTALQFPVQEYKYDHTIALLVLNGQKYYLDASDQYNPFGRIPTDCLNGYARIIDAKDTGGVWLQPEMAKEKSLFAITTTNNSANDYTLNSKFYFGDERAIELRDAWNDDTTQIKKYILEGIKKIDEDATLKDYKVLNLTNANEPLTLEFDIKMPWTASTIYMPANMIKIYENDPFKDPVRRYPVQMPACQNTTYTLNLKLPDGYTVDEAPKPAIIKMDGDNQFKNMVEYDKAANKLSVYARLTMPRIFYPVEDYSMLQEFFQKMGEAQQSNIVIKKL